MLLIEDFCLYYIKKIQIILHFIHNIMYEKYSKTKVNSENYTFFFGSNEPLTIYPRIYRRLRKSRRVRTCVIA